MGLETLVSSRIRRALLEHILSHPDGRVYLRGLAKTLGLALSPLRRELQRLEQLGVLRSYHEANIRFYVVDHASPHFARLGAAYAALGPGSETSPPLAAVTAGPVATPACPVAVEAPSAAASSPIEMAASRRATPPWLRTRVFVSLGLAAAAALVLVLHRSLQMMDRSAVSSRQAGRHAQIDVVRMTTFEPTASGEMRGDRWRLLPGVLGGFASTTSNPSQQNP